MHTADVGDTDRRLASMDGCVGSHLNLSQASAQRHRRYFLLNNKAVNRSGHGAVRLCECEVCVCSLTHVNVNRSFLGAAPAARRGFLDFCGNRSAWFLHATFS